LILFYHFKSSPPSNILGLAVLINRMSKPDVTVGVDGSLYRYHPRFKRNMERCMEALVHKDIKVRFMAYETTICILFSSSNWRYLMMVSSRKNPFNIRFFHLGSGKGAAMVACVADRSLSTKNE
jgi:hexokinase